jgi:bifunctional non-homologous end joining protein LigD
VTPSTTPIEVDGRRLDLSNLEKVLYPAAGFTKAQVIDYYARVAPAMLPHLAGRALTLVRCPDGVEGERFFEKRCPPHHPDWIPEVGGLRSCEVRELAGLVWLANLAALELHTLQARADEPGRPTAVVFDLDPGPPAGVLDCCRVALELRELLDELGLEAVVKTSGSKGLHLSIPLHTAVNTGAKRSSAGRRPTERERKRPIDADVTKAFALTIGRVLASRDPKRIVTDMRKELRRGRVFVDWSQNDEHKTTVAAYSLRIQPRPTVSTPVTWEEVEDALETADPDALTFETATVLERVAELGDLYAANDELDQQLPTRVPDARS